MQVVETNCGKGVVRSRDRRSRQNHFFHDQALSKAVDIIKKGINQNQYVLGVFCDISGAFDNVLHSSITTAMKSRGIGGNIIGWYDHFLQTRTVTSSLGESNASIRPGKGKGAS
jgi:hypothetical protein